MTDSYVCSGATMKCTCGDKTAKLTVLPSRTVFLTGQPMANISDHKSMVNLAPFGKCRSLGYPATASATAANHGKLTPMPCMHNTPFPWMSGKNDYIIKGDPALLKSSTCACMWGGTISLVTDGQTSTGNIDLSRSQIEEFEKDQEKKNQVDADSVLDGIQLALDAAGFIPGVGAVPDLLNAAIYAARGDMVNAGLSVLAAVPGIGDAAAAAKIAGKGVKIAKVTEKSAKTTKTVSKVADFEAFKEAKNAKIQNERAKWYAKEKESIRIVEGGKQTEVSMKKVVGQNESNTIYNSIDAPKFGSVTTKSQNVVKPIEEIVPIQSNRAVAKGKEREMLDIKKENESVLDFKSHSEREKQILKEERVLRETEELMKKESDKGTGNILNIPKS